MGDNAAKDNSASNTGSEKEGPAPILANNKQIFNLDRNNKNASYMQIQEQRKGGFGNSQPLHASQAINWQDFAQL